MRDKLIHERGAFLRDAVFSASDGLITTFAVVAGSQGASLSPAVVLIMGFANLLADGVSMSSGTYLGVKSEVEFEKMEGDRHPSEAAPLKQALITFLSFDIAGLMPLIPFIFKVNNAFNFSIGLVFIMLFVIGALRGVFVKKHWLKSGLEMLLIGGVSAAVAYFTGYALEYIILR